MQQTILISHTSRWRVESINYLRSISSTTWKATQWANGHLSMIIIHNIKLLNSIKRHKEIKILGQKKNTSTLFYVIYILANKTSKYILTLSMLVHIYFPAFMRLKAGGSPWMWDYLGLHTSLGVKKPRQQKSQINQNKCHNF